MALLVDLWKFLLVVEIDAEDVKFDIKEGVGKNGRPWKRFNQRGYFKRPGSKYPREFIFGRPEGSLPYPAGLYLVDPDSFDSGDYDSLELSGFDFALVPVPDDIRAQLEEAQKAKMKKVA